MRLTQNQIRQLEVDLMRKRNQPIPNSKFLYGEDVIWIAGGWADQDIAEICDIRANKALINTNNGSNPYLWVSLKHIYKQK